MTIRIALNAETKARLIAEANATGLPLEKIAEQLLTEALADRFCVSGRMSVEELHRMLGPLDLPTGSFSGESFNEGRSPFGRWRPW